MPRSRLHSVCRENTAYSAKRIAPRRLTRQRIRQQRHRRMTTNMQTYLQWQWLSTPSQISDAFSRVMTPITHSHKVRCLAHVGSIFNECCHCHCHHTAFWSGVQCMTAVLFLAACYVWFICLLAADPTDIESPGSDTLRTATNDVFARTLPRILVVPGFHSL